MYRIDTGDAVATLPAPAGLGTEGFWTHGNPGTGLAATTLDQDWFNSLQENLIQLLTAAGLPHSKSDYGRLWQALMAAFTFSDNGAANAMSVPLPTYLSFPPSSLVFGTTVRIKVAQTNTAAATLNFLGSGAHPVVRPSGAPLVGGELRAGAILQFVYDGAGNWQLLSPLAPLEYLDTYASPFNGFWTARAGITFCDVELWAPGGAGGGSLGSGDAGAGGGGGEYRRGLYSVTPGVGISLVLPPIATGGDATGSNGGTAGTANFGPLIANCGVGGEGSPGFGVVSDPVPAGGTGGSGGEVAIPGNNGGFGYLLPYGGVAGGLGGSAFKSPDPGPGISAIALAAHQGIFPGSGGNGGINGGVGGNGGPGFCIVRSWGA